MAGGLLQNLNGCRRVLLANKLPWRLLEVSSGKGTSTVKVCSPIVGLNAFCTSNFASIRVKCPPRRLWICRSSTHRVLPPFLPLEEASLRAVLVPVVAQQWGSHMVPYSTFATPGCHRSPAQGWALSTACSRRTSHQPHTYLSLSLSSLLEGRSLLSDSLSLSWFVTEELRSVSLGLGH